MQAAAGIPLTVYGKGGQRRGFLNIRDTVRCVELAILNPAKRGEYRVFNQFTETFTVLQLADLIATQARKFGLTAEVSHVANPRIEMEDHHYNPVHTKLLDLGLKPHFLSDELVISMLETILKYKHRIKNEVVLPKVKWNGSDQEMEASNLMWAGA